MRKIGLHLSISGGIYKSLEKAKELKINALQIFLKNSNRWKAPQYTQEVIEKFKQLKRNYNDIAVFAHTGYLINLAGNEEILNKSINALRDEIERAQSLGIEFLVLHPGSHRGTGEKEGIIRIADSIDRVYEICSKNRVKLLLETTAGQGSSIGFRFEHLAEIIDRSANKSKLKICLDTCHIFASGYDITTEKSYEDTISQLKKIIGLNKLKLIHLNDSKRELGSNIDRHEHIGKGMIGLKGFRYILNDPQLFSIPVILETPKNDENSDLINLNSVRKIINK